MGKHAGFLMIVVAILLVIIAGLSSAFVAMMGSSTSSSTSIIAANSAYNVAQAGIEDASYQISLNNCNATWSAAVSLAGVGQYQYNCSQSQGSTTTAAALSASSTSIPLTSAAGFDNFGSILIGAEFIYYNGISADTLLNARRGQYGTAPETHPLNSLVSQSQYIITSQAGTPSLSGPEGQITLTEAVVRSPGDYYAVGSSGPNSGLYKYNDATSWSSLITIGSFTYYNIETSSSYGLAVGFAGSGAAGTIYEFNGNAWSLMGTLANTSLRSASCNVPGSPTVCWVGGFVTSSLNMMLYSTATGIQYTVPAVGTFGSMSCVNNLCMAATGDTVYNFAVNSTNPFASSTFLGALIKQVTCPQSNSCVLVRRAGRVNYFNGVSWSAAFTISSQSLNGVHCPSTTNCIVVGDNGEIYNCSLPITSVASCVAQTSPGTMDLQAVHCNGTNDCLAVGSVGGLGANIAYRYLNGVWGTVPLTTAYTHNLTALTGTGTGLKVIPTVLNNQ